MDMSSKASRMVRKCALGVASGVLVLSVAFMGVGAQVPDEALAGPQLTASSDTSRATAAPSAETGQTDSADAGATVSSTPQLTSSSKTSQENAAANKADAAASASGQTSSTPKLGASSPSSSKTGISSKKDDASKADASVGDTFTMDADCAACHSKAAEKMADKGYTGELHQNLDCVFCHDNEKELTEAHANKYSAKQASRVVALNKTTVDEAVCLNCHGDHEALAESTADATVLTDSKGTTVNPHDIPNIDKHANITCGSCHKMHDDKTSDEAATNTCLNCHHDNVYECYTCHK